MNKLDDIRRTNLFILMNIAGGTVTALAKKTGIHRPALSALANGKEISDLYAAKLETAFEKPFGWLSKESDQDAEDYPVYDKELLQAAFACIYGIKEYREIFEAINDEGKADLFDKIYTVYTDTKVRELPLKTFYKLNIGGINEVKNKSKNARTKRNSKK